MSHEPNKPLPPDDDPDGTREWRALRSTARHQTVGMLSEIFALLRILLQDAIILVVGFAIEFAFEHWLHSEQPFFRFAVSVSSAVFLLLYLVMVTVHVVHYVREQFGTTAANIADRWLPWGLAAAGVIAAVVVYNMASLRSSGPVSGQQQVSRFTITLPQGDRLAAANNSVLAISPDGSRLVYTAIHGGVQQIYLREIRALDPRPMAGTEGAVAPFFSPDGQWVGFFASGSLKKISITGGAPVTIASAAGDDVASASWGNEGLIVFQTVNIGGLWRVADAGGGTPKQATSFRDGESTHRWPEVLPGGKAVLFSASKNPGNWSESLVALSVLSSGERHDLASGASRPAYAPSGEREGHLVYAQGGTLMAALFDAQRLALGGTAVPIQEGVSQSVSTGMAQYSISNNGSLVYVPGGIQEDQRTLVWVDRKGTEQPLKAAAHAYRYPRVSPEGRRVAVTIEEQGTQIWTYDLNRETLTRLTFQGSNNLLGAWTPDGKRIAFGSNSDGTLLNLWWQQSDGGGELERLDSSETIHTPNSFSPDGQLLAFVDNSPATVRDIWVLRMKDRKAQVFLKTPAEESAPRFSPDGRWLAYMSDESGRREIYVQPYPGPGGKWQISTDGGQEPVWNPNGTELFYRSGSRMMAVEVDTKNGFSASAPHVLFEGTYTPSPASLPNYDVSADGQRFLMLKSGEEQKASTQINVVLNWFEELKQKVPVK